MDLTLHRQLKSIRPAAASTSTKFEVASRTILGPGPGPQAHNMNTPMHTRTHKQQTQQKQQQQQQQQQREQRKQPLPKIAQDGQDAALSAQLRAVMHRPGA